MRRLWRALRRSRPSCLVVIPGIGPCTESGPHTVHRRGHVTWNGPRRDPVRDLQTHGQAFIVKGVTVDPELVRPEGAE